jgi:YHS domain-containing protein
VVRVERGAIIAETRHGYVCATAGVDASNVGGGAIVSLLPIDPDASAEGLRQGLQRRTGCRGPGPMCRTGPVSLDRSWAAAPAWGLSETPTSGARAPEKRDASVLVVRVDRAGRRGGPAPVGRCSPARYTRRRGTTRMDAPATAGSGGEDEPELDPVCGREVAGGAGGDLSEEYAGVTYRFCSQACLERFIQDTDIFTLGGPAGARTTRDRGVRGAVETRHHSGRISFEQSHT